MDKITYRIRIDDTQELVDKRYYLQYYQRLNSGMSLDDVYGLQQCIEHLKEIKDEPHMKGKTLSIIEITETHKVIETYEGCD